MGIFFDLPPPPQYHLEGSDRSPPHRAITGTQKMTCATTAEKLAIGKDHAGKGGTRKRLEVKYISDSFCSPSAAGLNNLRPTGVISVKGRLCDHLAYWKNIGANRFVLGIIQTGYRMPLSAYPPRSIFPNNRSALMHTEFVTSEIETLLATGRVVEMAMAPHNCK